MNEEVFAIVEEKLLSLIKFLKGYISIKEHDLLKEYADVGEYGLCLENICAIIKDEKITISIDVYNKIMLCGNMMKMDDANWTAIRKLVSQQDL